MSRSRDLITRKELAELFRCSVRQTYRYQEQGLPTHDRGGSGRPALFERRPAWQWYADNVQAARQARRELEAAKARNVRAQALLAEQKLAVERGELLYVDDVERALTVIIQSVRTKLLSWPGTLSGRLMGAATLGPDAVRAVLDEAAAEVIAEAERPPRYGRERKR